MKRFLCLLVVCVFCVTAFAETYRYKGKVGAYDVTVVLTTSNEVVQQGFGTTHDVKGSYTYTKAGNTLKLKGSDWTMTGLTELEEYTKSGRKSAEWHLEGLVGDDVLTGEFENLSNKKTFKVSLRLVK